MPLKILPGQPYFPDPNSPNNYNCGAERYCHPYESGDGIKTQFYQTPCEVSQITDPTFSEITLGAERLTNGSFTGNANDWETIGGALPSSGWSYDTNRIKHTPGAILPVFQVPPALSALTAGFYRIVIDITRVSGSVRVQMGDGATRTLTQYLDETGVYTIDVFYGDTLDQLVAIEPNTTDDFDGWINSISIKQITYNSWTPTQGWDLSNGMACHTSGQTGTLQESVANYIVANDYYEIGVTVTGYIAGSVDVYIANVLAGTINSNGTFYFYGTPTLAGVVKFTPTSTFVGCINFDQIEDSELQPGLFQLKNNHLAYVVDASGNEYAIGEYFQYYQRWVTLIYDFSLSELQYGCYQIKVVDACIVEGMNLIENGDFSEGSASWVLNNGGGQYQFTGGTAAFRFLPIEGLTYLTNGDFAAGFASWTAGANWSISGGGALHAVGSTAALTQGVVIPLPTSPPTPYNYWFRLTISGRTAGSISVGLGDATRTGFLTNGILMNSLHPTTSGAVNFTITPTSDFDGKIDDVELYYSNIPWSGTPFMTSAVNAEMVAGNYEVEFEIISQTDPRIEVGVQLNGVGISPTYFNTVGVHTVTVNNYIPGSQNLRIIGQFSISNYSINGSVVIDNVVVRSIEPFEATYLSECIKYGIDFNNTKLITAYCDQPAFEFEFANTGFFFSMRAVVRSIAPVYPTDTNIEYLGSGSARLTYASVEKYWQLHTAFASETFHDALSIMCRCDHFLIGTVEYIAQIEDYSPQWVANGAYSLAPAQINLRVKEGGKVFNRHL